MIGNCTRARTGPLLAIVLLVLVGPAVYADIDLEWRLPESHPEPTFFVGETVNIGLYAVSDDETSQSISAMDVLLDWDPVYLSLFGNDDTGAHDWLSSTFPDDAMNDTWLDGDGYYRAFAHFGLPAEATPAGLLVTTMQFTALAETPETIVTVPLYPFPGYDGRVTKTAVYDGEIPGYDVTGELDSIAIEIIPEPGTFSLVALAMLGLFRRRTR
ncbi:MAG: PEP-CTERM sorting domain-containing protein [Planctomycetes bacterium]|nr:PEP-CTERM sorting domain-containing protein [Planctomycetota bacterium]